MLYAYFFKDRSDLQSARSQMNENRELLFDLDCSDTSHNKVKKVKQTEAKVIGLNLRSIISNYCQYM